MTCCYFACSQLGQCSSMKSKQEGSVWGEVLRGNSQKYTRPNVSMLNLALLDDFQWVCSLLW